MLNAAELTGMRTTSASALPDTCTIVRPSTTSTLNEVSGAVTAGPDGAIYSGACRIRPAESQERDVEIGALHETLGRYVVTLPHDAGGIEVDDLLTVVASDDADLVTRRLRVKHVGWSGYQIDRRLIVQDWEQP